LFCNLVHAGEQSGALETMLDRVATYQERTESIKKKIKKALTYPIVILAIAFLVTAALLIFVVPSFQSLFQGFGADLPAPTLVVISLSKIFQAYWWMIFGSIYGIIYALFYFKRTSPAFHYKWDYYMLRVPIIGGILLKAIYARFTRTLCITFAAGLPLVDALDAVAGATGNLVYAKCTKQIKEQVSSGQQLQTAMRATHQFPPMVVQMIGIGEESGALETMLNKVALFYEEEVDAAVDNLSTLMEPIILVFLAVIIGGMVIAMYLPIFKLGSVV
jgi:type IV pilus assembly protein PilC